MKRKLIIMKEPFWVLEAVLCLQKFYKDDYDEMLDHSEKFGMTQDEFKKYFEDYTTYKDVVLKEGKPIFDGLVWMKPYLEYDSKHQNMLSSMVMEFGGNQLPVLEEKELHTYMAKNIINFLVSETSDDTLQEYRVDNFQDLFQLIMDTPVEDHYKMLLLNLYQNRTEIYHELQQSVKQMIIILKKHFTIIEESYKQASERMDSEEFEQMVVSGTTGLCLQDLDTVRVFTNVFGFNQIVASGETDIEIILVGIYFLHLHELHQRYAFEDGHLTDQLKALADVSRLKIIQLLATRRMYIQELSRKLELTPATVSHHIDVLMKNELITCVLAGANMKKVYYEVKKENLVKLGGIIAHLAE